MDALSGSLRNLCLVSFSTLSKLKQAETRSNADAHPIQRGYRHVCEMPLVSVHQTVNGWPFINLPVPRADLA